MAKKKKIKKTAKNTAKKAKLVKKSQPVKKKKKQALKKSQSKNSAVKNKSIKSSKAATAKKTKSSKKAESKKSSIKKTSAKSPLKAPAQKQAVKKSKLHFYQEELKKVLKLEKEEKIAIKNIKGQDFCLMENCDYPAVVEGYCRIHFFALYPIIIKKKEIIEKKLLNKSFSALSKKYSSAILDQILKDLSSEKNFNSALKKINLESLDEDHKSN